VGDRRIQSCAAIAHVVNVLMSYWQVKDSQEFGISATARSVAF
jgi:hypothetical protein